MAIFKLTSSDGKHECVVRARCLSCARIVAAEYAGEEGASVWVSRELSRVELVRPNEHATMILRSAR